MYFVNGYVLPAYQCHQIILKEYKKQRKKISYKVVHDVVLRLEKAGFIKWTGKKGTRNAINMKITTLGIFYIFRDKLFYHGHKIIENNLNDGLFETFLYPCIEQKIVLRINDSYLIDIIFDYLAKCCDQIECEIEIYRSIEKSGSISLSVATTESIMADDLKDIDAYGLKAFTNFLSDRFSVQWLKNETIKTKIRKNSTNEFVISKGKNRLTITLYFQKSYALVSHSGLSLGKIDIEKNSENDEDNEYLFIDNREITIEELWQWKNYHVHGKLKKLSLDFCSDVLDYCCTDFYMTSKESKSKVESVKLLKSSPNFMKLLNEMATKTESQFNHFNSIT
jgi:hypothetical protein